jgi:hypothetical protein
MITRMATQRSQEKGDMKMRISEGGKETVVVLSVMRTMEASMRGGVKSSPLCLRTEVSKET